MLRRCLLLVFALCLVGCSRTAAPPPVAPAAPPAVVPAPDPQVVPVALTDTGIEMTRTLPPGVTAFQVTNSGRQPHGFGIQGPALDHALGKPLQPGEAATLQVRLQPGAHVVTSPGTPALKLDLAVRGAAAAAHTAAD